MTWQPLTAWGSAATVLLAVIAFIRIFLVSQIRDLRTDVTTLKTQVFGLQQENAEQRSEKHRVKNDLTRAELILRVVGDLKAKCTCDALAVLDPIFDDFMASLNARNRRSTDDKENPS